MMQIDFKNAGLYADEAASAVAWSGGGNAGLYFEKYFDTLAVPPESAAAPTTETAEDVEDRRAGEKRAALESWLARAATNGVVGQASELAAAVRRRRALVGSLGGCAFAMATVSPLAVGMGKPHRLENGLTWHPTLGVPYIPGAAVKGALSHAAMDWGVFEDQPEGEAAWLTRLFGAPRPAASNDDGDESAATDLAPEPEAASAGQVIFFDAIPCAPVPLIGEVMTPHYAPYYENGPRPAALGDWHGPKIIPYPAVGRDAVFCFALALRPGRAADTVPPQLGSGDLPAIARLLGEVLETVGIGAKTAVGLGRFCPTAWPREGRG